MKASKQTIVDVRTPEEYKGGHVAGSINIPLQQVPARLNEFADLPQPLVLCCTSGNRSGQAVAYLREQGITCENGGSWRSVNELVNQ